jgi:hypothetical protein
MDLKAPRPTSSSASSSERGGILGCGRVVVAVAFGAALGGAVSNPAAADGGEPPAGESQAAAARAIDPSTFVDHDAYPPIPEPAFVETDLNRFYVSNGFVQPLADALDLPGAILDLAGAGQQESANVNEFDEVPNTSWFTNRNHFRAVPVEDILLGPGHGLHPETPWKITKIKQTGATPGFQIKDAAGKRWVVKLDPPAYAQIGSGADVVVSRLLYAAGYNVPHDEAITFRREDLNLDPELVAGKDGQRPFTAADLDVLVGAGARSEDGRYYGLASLFLPKPIGNAQLGKLRQDDPNDWYTHRRHRELRGLRILAAWLNDWDTKDQQTLDSFQTTSDSLGHVEHYLIDLGGALGATTDGPKRLKTGYEYAFDPGWIARRIATLGFITEPWRSARQVTEIPAVGSFQADNFNPDDYRPMMPHLAFQECTAREAYWGAKIVASFSDAQIAAAVSAAGYEDPRASAYLVDALKKRRDAIARLWFGRVAPLDFFQVRGGRLDFRDLAVDRDLCGPHRYTVRVEPLTETQAKPESFAIASPTNDLTRFDSGAPAVRLTLGIAGENALPTQVEIRKSSAGWQVTRVRHG